MPGPDLLQQMHRSSNQSNRRIFPFDHEGLADPKHHKHNTDDGQQFSDLTASLIDYNAILPDGHQQLDRPAELKDVSMVAIITEQQQCKF